MTDSPAPDTAIDPFVITIREVPEMVVAFEFAERHVHELPGWLPGAMSRVYETADTNGGIARTDVLPYLNRDQFAPEPVFIVIYDGHPDHGAMRVDVTSPIAGADPSAAAGNDALLVVPAHREAFVRLKRSQADPADLGEAYEAVERWILDRGHRIAAAPREVYFTDFMGASPYDEVCDIAWPIA
ncbi:MAG: GyrI-like domain-containing protein [Thermomicrobiales bacterium]